MSSYTSGTKTESVGTYITQICPANDTNIPVLTAVSVTTTGTTDQNLYVCSALGIFETKRWTQDGTTTTEVHDIAPGGYELVANDYVIAINDQGRYEVLEVDSISGSTITWKTGPVEDLPIRTLLYSYYNPTDSGKLEIPAVDPTATQPCWKMPAGSEIELRSVFLQAGRDTQLDGVDTAVRAEGTPMLVILSNDTDQATLEWCSFIWIPRENDASLRIGETMAGAAKAELPPPEEE